MALPAKVTDELCAAPLMKKNFSDAVYQRLVRLGAPSKTKFLLKIATYLIAIATCAIVFVPGKATFTTEALTEQFEIEVPRLGFLPPWDGMALLEFKTQDGKACDRPVFLFTSIPGISVNTSDENLAFVASSRTKESYLIKVAASTGATLPGRIRCESGLEYAAPKEVIVEVRSTSALSAVFRIQGVATIGGTGIAGYRNELKILREGKLRVGANALPFGSGTITESVDLIAGDTLKFFSSAFGRDLARGVMLVRYDGDSQAFRVVMNVQAYRANVYRAGSARGEELSIAPSFWARLQAQRSWVLIVLVFGLVLGFLRACEEQFGAIAQHSNGK